LFLGNQLPASVFQNHQFSFLFHKCSRFFFLPLQIKPPLILRYSLVYSLFQALGMPQCTHTLWLFKPSPVKIPGFEGWPGDFGQTIPFLLSLCFLPAERVEMVNDCPHGLVMVIWHAVQEVVTVPHTHSEGLVTSHNAGQVWVLVIDIIPKSASLLEVDSGSPWFGCRVLI
jgi:hypothetical protein